jgi:hypothetical protein
MEPPGNEESIGQRVRTLRKARGWSLGLCTERATCTVTLSQGKGWGSSAQKGQSPERELWSILEGTKRIGGE